MLFRSDTLVECKLRWRSGSRPAYLQSCWRGSAGGRYPNVRFDWNRKLETSHRDGNEDEDDGKIVRLAFMCQLRRLSEVPCNEGLPLVNSHGWARIGLTYGEVVRENPLNRKRSLALKNQGRDCVWEFHDRETGLGQASIVLHDSVVAVHCKYSHDWL